MMKDANREVLERLGAVPARELDVAWDGIGGWMG